MQLLKALWALAGAALCCFLVLVIHAQFLKEGNCPPRARLPARSAAATAAALGPARPAPLRGPAAGADPSRRGARCRAHIGGPGRRAARVRQGFGAAASVPLAPPSPRPEPGRLCRPLPRRALWQRRPLALLGPSVDGTRAPRWRPGLGTGQRLPRVRPILLRPALHAAFRASPRPAGSRSRDLTARAPGPAPLSAQCLLERGLSILEALLGDLVESGKLMVRPWQWGESGAPGGRQPDPGRSAGAGMVGGYPSTLGTPRNFLAQRPGPPLLEGYPGAPEAQPGWPLWNSRPRHSQPRVAPTAGGWLCPHPQVPRPPALPGAPVPSREHKLSGELAWRCCGQFLISSGLSQRRGVQPSAASLPN